METGTRMTRMTRRKAAAAVVRKGRDDGKIIRSEVPMLPVILNLAVIVVLIVMPVMLGRSVERIWALSVSAAIEVGGAL
jgi:hypothetical protein